jgi:hypothetical protein
MKTIVIYKSKTGYTKQYAQWIAEELSADILPADKVSFQKLAEYDCIIFGGRLYAVGIDGLSLIKKNFDCVRRRCIAGERNNAEHNPGCQSKRPAAVCHKTVLFSRWI